MTMTGHGLGQLESEFKKSIILFLQKQVLNFIVLKIQFSIFLICHNEFKVSQISSLYLWFQKSMGLIFCFLLTFYFFFFHSLF